MKKLFLLLTFFVGFVVYASAQNNVVRPRMAIFTPLYIDDAFDNAGSYKYSGKTFPKQSISGLEFYHGASLAIDSLNRLNVPLEVYIYDSKSRRETLEQQFSKCAADGVALIIANCSLSELTTLARLGADKKITVVNATVPNSANATDNPYFVVMNATIQTQLEELYKFIKKNYAGKQITFITRKQSGENYIRNVAETLNKFYKDSIKMTFREVNDEIALKALGTSTQPTQTGVFLVGSLDTDFGNKVLEQLSANSNNYASVTVIGMPTWENLGLSKAKYKGLEIIYSTPFYNPRTDGVSGSILDYYSKRMHARPSDLVFRGYALTYTFGQLVNRYGKEVNNKLGVKEFRSFIDFNIKPEYLNGKISHYENKKLYYLRYFNGTLRVTN